MYISIVTPTFNRYELLKESICSVIESSNESATSMELIIVDDASTDNTFEKIQYDFGGLISSGFIRVYRLETNCGVTAAKNFGARNSTGEWVLFLDSDDLLIPEHFSDVVNELVACQAESAVFFRCVDFDGVPIGEQVPDQTIDLGYYIKHGMHGERLPVIKREAITKFPYDDRLRGFEGLTYFTMLRSGLKFRLSNITARKYRTDNVDRLSLHKARTKRAREMKMGYESLLAEYKLAGIMPPLKIRIKHFYYQIISR